MAIRRVVVTFPMDSGLPEDASQNTFHFEKSSAFTTQDGLDITSGLQDFYDGAHLPGAFPISSFLSGFVANLEVFATHYDLIVGAPGEDDDLAGSPVAILPMPLNGPTTGTTPLPTEVSVCLSYKGSYTGVPEVTPMPPSGPAGDIRGRARRRGRIYIGPLNSSAIDSTNARPSTNLMNTLAGAGVFMDGAATPPGINWVVYSRKNGDVQTVTDGWVDNEFDTQRRRGRDATTRQLWS